jgi:predicted PurR-regulated permease PerM
MQLLLALLILVGVALGVFLIILLARLIGTLKRVSSLIDDIHEPVKTMTGTAREGVEAVGNAARSVGEGFKSIFRPAASSSHASHLGSIIDIVSQIAGVVGYFTERKKDGAKAKRARGRRR